MPLSPTETWDPGAEEVMMMGARKRRRADVVHWAHSVAEGTPHSLRDLEDQLRSQAEPDTTIHPLSLVGTLALIAGLTVFIDASDGIEGDNGQTLTFDFDTPFELTVAAVSFTVVCLFQARLLHTWWANGRVRDTTCATASAFVAVCSGIVLYLVVDRMGTIGASILPVLDIVLVGLALLAALTCVVLSLSGRKPSTWPTSKDEAPLVNLAALPRSRQEPLLTKRSKALRILIRRGLLDIDDRRLTELSARSLGRLDVD